jgi:uncharacterized protein YrzB (UPF0473 family)
MADKTKGENTMDENKDLTPEEELEEDLVVLVDEDDHEHTFQVIETFELNGQEYAVLFPWEEEEEDSAVVLRIVEENGEDMLYDIEDDAEWEAVAAYWNEHVDEEENEAE